jgi:hypothetical protein
MFEVVPFPYQTPYTCPALARSIGLTIQFQFKRGPLPLPNYGTNVVKRISISFETGVKFHTDAPLSN